MSADNYSYVCSLDDASVKKAKRELNEDTNERQGVVEAFRQWMKREKWIKAPSNTLFILSFLRVCKFSQLRARERLINFLVSMNDSVRYMKGVDPGDPTYLDILRQSRVFTPLPKPDSEGRVIVLGNYDNFDPSGESYKYEDFQRAIMSLCHSLVFFNEQFQVNGVVFLMDYRSVTLKHISFGGSENMRKRAQHFQKALPVQIKVFHHYNNGPMLDALVKILRPALPEKMRPRVKTHGHSMVSVYRSIDMELLPAEYLPDDYTGPSAGTLKEITEMNIEKYILDPVKREFLQDLYKGDYFVDVQERKKEDEEIASFRQLSVT